MADERRTAMASPYLPHPLAPLPEPGLLVPLQQSRRSHCAQEHARATQPPGGEHPGQLPGDPYPDRRLASGDHPSPRSHSFGLPALPTSVGAARRRVCDVLSAWNVPEETRDNAVIVTSELVTNAVTHSASDHVVCRLLHTADRLRIEVEDQNRSAERPTPRHADPDDQSGRGLLLVAAVSSDWGVGAVAHRPGRIVWAELVTAPQDVLPTTPPPTAAAPGPSPTRPKELRHAPKPRL
ncbi:ATP-binding protein [Streptomyces sp. NPDC088387]|uniref:ATP-binding protein n=1 Tax=Streptomyces sp. NPDC088387 TaxID=3365859 RepID=UPI0037F92F5E